MSLYETHTESPDAALDFSGRAANHDELNFRQWNASRHAQYFTPVACARALYDTLTALLDTPAESLTVLDPTAGNGRLLHPWKSAGAAVFGIELDDAVYARAQRVLGADAVRHGDILDYAPYLAERFDLVLTNPPYGLRFNLTGKDLMLDTRPAYGDTIESQTACLEIAIRALHHGGLLVAIIPTGTWTNEKDQRIKQYLYRTYQVWARITVENLFYPEYRITPVVDVVLAQKLGSHTSAWPPYETRVVFTQAGALDAALRGVLGDAERVQRIRRSFYASGRGERLSADIPRLDHLQAIPLDRAVTITPRGLQAGLAAESLLHFLNATVEDFSTIQGTRTGIVEAHASVPALIQNGTDAAEALLAALGFTVTLSPATRMAVQRQTRRYAEWSRPLYAPKPHQLLAYFEDRPYPALDTVHAADGAVLFTKGQRYHLRPTWTRHVTEISREYIETASEPYTKVVSVDRGYLTLEATTEQGTRRFEEPNRADVETLVRAFGLPAVADLADRYPQRVAHWRRVLGKRFPFLKPYQHEDLARACVKPVLGNFYTMGGGKTVTSTIFALARGYRRILVVCQSSHVEHWLAELRDKFGLPHVYPLTTHAAISELQEQKRRKVKPDAPTVYVSSYEFLSLDTRRVFDRWECVKFDRDGGVIHSETNTTRKCHACSVEFRQAIKACPKCHAEADRVKGWTGEVCRACGYVAYTYSRYREPAPSYFGRPEAPPDNFPQYPAYKRLRKLFSCIIVDEAQQAKSSTSARGQAVHALKAKGRVLSTGTLLKGYVTDAYANLAWLLGCNNPLFPFEPGAKGRNAFLEQFGTFKYVSKEFADTLSRGPRQLIPAVSNLNRFARLLGGFSLRRTAEDLPPLPPRRDRVLSLPMDAAHQAFYHRIESRCREEMDHALHSPGLSDQAKLAIISRCLWQLRFAATVPISRHLSEPLTIERWNKLDQVVALVREAQAAGEKVLVFSGLREMVGAVRRALTRAGVEHLCVTAQTGTRQRFRLVEEFSRNGAVAIVAGLNVLNRCFNIQAASRIIFCDADWTPEAIEQAQARCWRQGQTRETHIYHLLSAGTIDENILDLATQKQQAIVHAIDGQAFYQDTAEFLQQAAKPASVQMRLAQEILARKSDFRYAEVLAVDNGGASDSSRERPTLEALRALAARRAASNGRLRKTIPLTNQRSLFG